METLGATPVLWGDRAIMPGNTGSEMLMLLFLISLTFNLVSVCVGGIAICCLYKELVLWPCKGKRKAQHDVYYLAKYGDRIHSTDKCPTLVNSTDVKKFKPCTKCFKWVEAPKDA